MGQPIGLPERFLDLGEQIPPEGCEVGRTHRVFGANCDLKNSARGTLSCMIIAIVNGAEVGRRRSQVYVVQFSIEVWDPMFSCNFALSSTILENVAV